jgi:hypothetical protein
MLRPLALVLRARCFPDTSWGPLPIAHEWVGSPFNWVGPHLQYVTIVTCKDGDPPFRHKKGQTWISFPLT